MKRRLALAAALLAAVAVPSLVARAQSAGTQWDYLRLTPGVGNIGGAQRSGYTGCHATDPDWTCRQFQANEKKGAEDGLRKALAALGTEGWELVAVIDETEHLSPPKGLTYLFKRQRSR